MRFCRGHGSNRLSRLRRREGILTLASASGTGWWLMGLLSLAALFFPFAAGIRRQPARLFCEGSLLFYAG